MNYKIVKANINDFNNLWPLVFKSQIFQKKDLEKQEIQSLAKLRESLKSQVKDWLSHADKVYYIAKNDKHILGYVVGMLDGVTSKDGSLTDLFVDEQWRGYGIGPQFNRAVESWLKKNKMTSVVLAVHKTNSHAVHFYKTDGYSEISDNYMLLKKKI